MLVLAACVHVVLLGLAAAEPQLVDAVAAVIDRRVITRTEVDVEARMALIARGVTSPFEVALDNSFRGAMLDALLVEELLALEARRTVGVAVREADVDAAMDELRQHLEQQGGYDAFLARVSLDEEGVRTILRRQLTVRGLLARLFGALPDAAPADVALYARAHPGASEADARAALRRAAEEKLVAARVETLKRLVDWRLVAPWARTVTAP